VNDDRDLITNETTGTVGLVDAIALLPNATTQIAEERINSTIDMLKSYHILDTNGEYLISYGQDMEAWGLWQEEQRNTGWDSSVVSTMQRLDAFLARLEQEVTWLEVTNPGTFIDGMKARLGDNAFESIQRIDSGEAMWMHYDAQRAGYSSWRSWLESTTWLDNYNSSFATARTMLKNVENQLQIAKDTGRDASGAEKLFKYAMYVFVANQYEYGCIGCRFSWFHRVKVAMIPGMAAIFALNRTALPNQTVVEFDADNDGENEYLIITPREFYVYSSYGARLVFAANLELGTVFVGGDQASTYTGNGVDYDAPGSLQKYTPTISRSDHWNRGTDKTYRIHQKAFNDELEGVLLATKKYESIVTPIGVRFWLTVNNVTVTKEAYTADDSIWMSYVIDNEGSEGVNFDLSMSLAPEGLELIEKGRFSLKPLKSAQFSDTSLKGILEVPTENSSLQILVRAPATLIPRMAEKGEELWGVLINAEFPEIGLKTRSTARFRFSLLNTTSGDESPPLET
ncbi:MAG TPA: hypothetical protein VJ044_12510, partial [Candidatus Hodarchaeales archaeon]|nr:hypothetical protein [Candidatus Hodarchaeales archaeon]